MAENEKQADDAEDESAQAPQMMGDMGDGDEADRSTSEPVVVDDELGDEKPSRNVRFRPGRRSDRGD